MDEVRCPHCGAVPAAPDARLCHACGGVIGLAEEPLPPPPAEPLPPPPAEPPPPPAPGGGVGRSRAARRLGPFAVGVAGLGLLVGGIVIAAGGGDDRDLSSVLRTGGVLLPATTSVPEVPSPAGTTADFTTDHTGTPITTLATGDGAVALMETFDDNGHGWPTGQSADGAVARSLVDGAYRVSLASSEVGVLAYTWTPGFGSLVDFSVEVEAVRHGPSAAACGLGLMAEGDYPRVALMVDDVNLRFRAVARASSEASIEELIGWTESPVIERDAPNLVSILFEDGDTWLSINDTVVGRLDAIPFDPAQVALVARGPGGGEAAACDFDDLVIREL